MTLTSWTSFQFEHNIDDFDLINILKDIADKDQTSNTNQQNTDQSQIHDQNKAMVPQNMQIASANSTNVINFLGPYLFLLSSK